MWKEKVKALHLAMSGDPEKGLGTGGKSFKQMAESIEPILQKFDTILVSNWRATQTSDSMLTPLA